MISRSKAFRSRKTVTPSVKPKSEKWPEDEEKTEEEAVGMESQMKEAMEEVGMEADTNRAGTEVAPGPEEKNLEAPPTQVKDVPEIKVSKVPVPVEAKGSTDVKSSKVPVPDAKVPVPDAKVPVPDAKVPVPDAKTVPVVKISKEPDSPADVKREILQGLNSEPTATDFSSSRPSKGGQLAKIREEHLKKRGLKHVTMPELAETSETESVKGGSMDSDSDRSSHGDKMLEMNITENPIYPSLPDHFLKKIGAARNSEVSPDQLSDHELEEKFASLSLAFKTDRQTLEQRVQLQERARDMAEQNVEREMEGIRKTVKNLGQFGSEADYRDLLNKLQQHLEVLEQSTARVSSRAELLGAVQQEDRMSRAIDIMVNHNDSLKQRYDRLLQELEESRKLLQENRILPPGASGDFGGQSKSGHHTAHHLRNHTGAHTSSRLGQSSASSHQLDEAGKRRASVAAFPRLFGSLGSSSGNLADKSAADVLATKSVPVVENPKQRFQNVIANTTVTNSVTSFLRRSSHERSLTPPPDKSTPTDDKTSTPGSENDVSPTKHTCLSPDDALPKSSPRKLESSARKTSNSKKVDEKEEVFQKGFEQGVRTSISAELGDLREQQTIFCENLEHLMEENQTDDEDDEETKEHFLDKMWQYLPEWDKSGKKLRLVIGGIAFMMGIFTIILTVQQVTSASRTNISLEELVAPYVQYRYFGGNKPA